MKKRLQKILGLATSGTAKDTYILFGGNIFSAFLGFLFTIIIARALTVSDFGVFSAASNLIIILISLSDFGLSSGVVNFVSIHLARSDKRRADEYAKAAFVVRVVIAAALSLLVVIFAGYIAEHWLATADKQVAYLVSLISFIALAWGFLPYILQAKKLFFKSVLLDIFVGLPRLLIPLIFIKFGILNVKTTLFAFAAGVFISAIAGFIFTGIKFLFARPRKDIYLDLAKFSGWLGVNRVITSISGRLDIQMLAALAGATATGLYSIPSKLTSFLIILASSFSSVLAPRMASFGDKNKERVYLVKSTIVTLGIILLTIVWIIVAKPFVLILFGQKYLPSVPVFQALTVSMIPFILTVPSVTAIIYSMKKTVYIGSISFFNMIAIFAINYIFIPKFGVFGPTISFGVTNTILAIYTWIIVIRYYWGKK
ncbi:oligosaccharide flippase family protein [Patescibacteria group bacterium]|nr:oligosaccharide flippase family protein [Patescibacteria group bacterium]